MKNNTTSRQGTSRQGTSRQGTSRQGTPRQGTLRQFCTRRMKYCQTCGNQLTPQQIKEQIKPVKVKFFNERQPEEAEVIPYNDAFFEVITGKHKGNLIHIFDIIKN